MTINYLDYGPKSWLRVHIIDVSIDGFFIRKPTQSRLDAFLYPIKESISTELIESGIKLPEKPIGVDWYK
jgi:hypothetical protein